MCVCVCVCVCVCMYVWRWGRGPYKLLKGSPSEEEEESPRQDRFPQSPWQNDFPSFFCACRHS